MSTITSSKIAIAIAAATMIPALPVATALAQEAPAIVELAEVLVSARKREENLMQVPIAVSVMTSEAIEASGVANLAELSAFTPGLTIKAQGSGTTVDRGQSRLVFRGLSSSEGVIFIDGAPYAGNSAPDVTDLERLEVLNGPQSVYFGRSTFSGAANYVTKTPGDEFAARVGAEAYSYSGRKVTAMVEGPLLGDRVTARVNARRYEYGGQYRNGVGGQELGKQTTTSASVALAFKPTSNLAVRAYYNYQFDHDGQPAMAGLRVLGPKPALNCNLGGTGGTYWCGELPSLSQLDPTSFGGNLVMDPLTRSELIDNVRGTPVPFDTHWLNDFGYKREIHHAHVRADLSLAGGWEASLLVAYSRTKLANLAAREAMDSSNILNTLRPATAAARAAACAVANPAANSLCFRPDLVRVTTYQLIQVNDYSTELRLSSPQDRRVRGTVGGSYFGVSGPITANFGQQNTGRLILGGNGGLKLAVRTPAIFAGLYFDATDKLTLGAEGRYQWDGITQRQQFTALGAPPGPELKDTFKSFSPRVTADYKISPVSLLYATFSRGYRPGGFNPNLSGLAQSVLDQLSGTNLSFKEEQLDNFEIGHKQTWMNNRLRTTLALYTMTWTNGQIRNTFFATLPSGATQSIAVTTNSGKVDLRGAEFATDFAATQNLTLAGTFDYSYSKLVNFILNPNGLLEQNNANVSGKAFDQTPKFSMSFSPSYRRPIGSGWDFNGRVDMLYRSKVYIDTTNLAWLAARGVVNLKLGVVKDKTLKVELFANNLFDDDNITGGARTGDGVYGTNTACPPCYNPALPVPSAAALTMNLITLGLPEQRTVGLRASYEF
jgi:iron complex outermembrane receptor protein